MRCHAKPAQVIVGADRVSRDALLGRASTRTAAAPVIEQKDAVAVGPDRLDLCGTIRGIAGVAGKIEQSRLAVLRGHIPGDEPRAVGGLEHDLLDIGEPGILGRNARAVRDVDEVTMQQTRDDAE